MGRMLRQQLLLMMLPAESARLLIYGKPGDLDELHREIDADPDHSMMLWPGDGALTVEQLQSLILVASSTARGCCRSSHSFPSA